MRDNEWRSQLYRIVSFSSGALILNWLYYSVYRILHSNVVFTHFFLLCANAIEVDVSNMFKHNIGKHFHTLAHVRSCCSFAWCFHCTIIAFALFPKIFRACSATMTENVNVIINGLNLDYCRLFIYGENFISLLSYFCNILLSRSCAHFANHCNYLVIHFLFSLFNEYTEKSDGKSNRTNTFPTLMKNE